MARASRARLPGSQGIRWRGPLIPHLTLFTVAFERGVSETLQHTADDVQAYAQENAPWEDRTGDARAGLTAAYRHRLAYHYIDLFHTVEYGIWLEIRWNGRFAIIVPTLEHFGPRVMANLDMAEILGYGYH